MSDAIRQHIADVFALQRPYDPSRNPRLEAADAILADSVFIEILEYAKRGYHEWGEYRPNGKAERAAPSISDPVVIAERLIENWRRP